MAGPIKTSGDLRVYLAMTLQGVKTGDISIEQARTITKLAAQINESIYAEIKNMKVHAELEKPIPDLGTLPLGTDTAK